MEKMTYVSLLNDVIAMDVLNAEQTEKMNSLIASLEKRSTYKSNKPSKNQLENEVLKERIYNCMVEDLEYTCTQLISLLSFLKKEDGTPFSTQKVSSLLHSLEADKLISSKVVKGKTYFIKFKAN